MPLLDPLVVLECSHYSPPPIGNVGHEHLDILGTVEEQKASAMEDTDLDNGTLVTSTIWSSDGEGTLGWPLTQGSLSLTVDHQHKAPRLVGHTRLTKEIQSPRIMAPRRLPATLDICCSVHSLHQLPCTVSSATPHCPGFLATLESTSGKVLISAR